MIRIRLYRTSEGATAADGSLQPGQAATIASDVGLVAAVDRNTLNGTSAGFSLRTVGIDMAAWSDLAGRTAGDAVGRLFRLPLSAPILAVSQDAVRREVSTSLARLSPDLAVDEASRLIDRAWQAFGDGLARNEDVEIDRGRL